MMSLQRIGHSCLAALTTLALAACSTAHIDKIGSARDQRLYAELHPYYVEVCAVSELKKKPGFGIEISSGMGGHSIIYLNGVCRDRRAGYPVIDFCDPETPPDERGVGLSDNAHFKNAEWVAVPGRDFLFHGTLKPGERLTRSVYLATQARAKALGLYDGIRFHRDVYDDRPKDMSRRDFKYEISVATDYAISFGRDRYCARVPVDHDQMAAVIRFLNGLNAPYREGTKNFDWNVFNNNCSHVSHNALASADIWNRWPTGEFAPFAAFDFPVPKNEFVDVMRRTNDMPINDIDAIYDDLAARAALLHDDSLPTGPGALAEAEPAAQQNDLYDTDLRLIFYDDPIFGSYSPRFDRIFSEPRYTDLEANLQHFAALYRRIEQQRQPLAAFVARHHPSNGTERQQLTRFYDRYYRYMARSAALVSAQRAVLARAEPTAAPELSARGEESGSAASAARRSAEPSGVPGS